MKTSRWRKWLLIAGGSVALAFLVAHQAIVHTGPPTKEEWLQQQAARLKGLTVTEEMLTAANVGDDWGAVVGWCCRIRGEGVIRLSDGEWVYVVCHSSHENDFTGGNRSLRDRLTWRIRRLRRLLMGERYRQPVGDAILAMDQEGRLYTNDGHVCGDLQLAADGPIESLDDFLKTRSQDSEPPPWKEMK